MPARLTASLSILLLSLACGGGLFAKVAMATPTPVLSIDFDSGFDGVRADGTVIQGSVRGLPRRVPGRHGSGMLAGPLAAQVLFPTDGIINQDQGAIELWIRPVDWDASDKKFHVFFEVAGTGALYLYKYMDSPRLLMLATDNRDQGPYQVSEANVPWQRNVWTHVIGSWSREGVSLYVNGQSALRRQIPAHLPQALPPFFTIGDLPWSSARISSTVIDDVRIYDRSLSAIEADNLYSIETGHSRPAGAATLGVEHFPESASGLLRVEVTTIDPDMGSTGKAVVHLAGSAGPVPGMFSADFKAGRAIGAMSYRSLKPGSYNLVVDAISAAGAKIQSSESIEIPNLSFLGGDEAKRSLNSAPGNTPYFDGRSRIAVRDIAYQLREGALLDAIAVSGTAVVPAPIRVSFGRHPEKSAVMFLPWKAVPHTDGDSLRFESSGHPLADEAIRVTATEEFFSDGLIWVKISAAQQSEQYRSGDVIVDIPIADDVAKFFYLYREAGGTSEAFSESVSGVEFQGEFIPFLWVGDDYRGLFWFAETAKGWPNRHGSNAVELVKDDGQVHLRLRPVAGGQKLPDSWSIEFGLQPTPSKSRPANWRQLKLTPSATATTTVLWPAPQKDSFKYYGYPEAADADAMRSRLNGLREKQIRAIPYVCPTCISLDTPEWQFLRSLWDSGRFDTPGDATTYRAGLAMVGPAGRGWRQFIVQSVQRFTQAYDISGIYLDNAQIQGIYAPNMKLGYEIQGRREKEFPIRSYRRLFSALRDAVSGQETEKLVIGHVSGSLPVPSMTSFDAYVDGEQFRGKVKDNYLEVLSLAQLRAEFSGRQFGLAPIFLPEFDSDVASQRQPTRGLMGLMMLHDILVWPLWSNVEEVNRANTYLAGFRGQDTVFHPYFDKEPPGKSSIPGVYASAYEANGHWLMVITNTTREPQVSSVCLSQSKGLASRAWKELPSATRIGVSVSGCLRIAIPGLDYKLLSS